MMPICIGELTSACARCRCPVYSHIVNEVVVAQGMREADMASCWKNTYRHVNIALVNEMAVFCHEMDIDLGM